VKKGHRFPIRVLYSVTIGQSRLVWEIFTRDTRTDRKTDNTCRYYRLTVSSFSGPANKMSVNTDDNDDVVVVVVVDVGCQGYAYLTS